MILSSRQYTILAWLARYKYVCVEQFHRHLFRGTTRRNAEIALQKLEKAGLLKRLSLPRGSGKAYGAICYLTTKGAQQLSELHRQPFRPVHKPIQSLNHYAHRKYLIDFLIALDSSVKQMPNLEVKQLLTEFRSCHDESGRSIETKLCIDGMVVVPDAIFVLRNRLTKREAAFCVEIDTAKETIGMGSEVTESDTLMSKFRVYERLIESGAWRSKVDSVATAFEVLFVSTSESHVRSVLKATVLGLDHPEFFLGSAHDFNHQKNVLLKPIWSRSLETKPQPLLS